MGSRLGFMSFFIKAAIEALKAISPSVNHIDGNEIVLHNYFDISASLSVRSGPDGPRHQSRRPTGSRSRPDRKTIAAFRGR